MLLSELASSIRELGVIQPITVRKLEFNKYQLISGERRFRASKLVGLDNCSCLYPYCKRQRIVGDGIG